jgi:hypothetical protein
MATERQIRANRENAQASTGLSSPAGKSAVSKNALRHGLTATSIDQFPAEIQHQYLDFRDTLQLDFQPGTSHEQLLFEKYAFAQFLSVRAQALHAQAIEQALTGPTPAESFQHLARIQRYQRSLDRSAAEALKLLQQSYADRCAAVDLQDLVTNTLNSPVVIPAAAPVSQLLNSTSLRTDPDTVALRITFVEQGRMGRQNSIANSNPETNPQ